ncbi:MAG TPA: polysaccharide ABC transporter ATP-binding protein [Tepidisphaeraceae bacterium]|nr:polysaccharide ABC transporter ATP-binding protein [Tepidisphaeraceae bacterium]
MSSRSDIAISVRGLSKAYRIDHDQEKHVTLAETVLARLKNPLKRPRTETFWALKGIEFDVKRGEVVGIIGRNGAGKSTLLKILSRITEPTSGYVDLYGRVGSLLEVGTGFHPELTGRENIFLNGAILGMTRPEIRKQFDAIVDFAGVEQFLDTPVKRYSSGMYVRLAFAVAAHLESEILIVDEVLAVGDAEFQRKCLGKMKDVARTGKTVLFVSHHMQSVRVLCNHGIYLECGRVSKIGTVDDIVRCYVASFEQSSTTSGGTADQRPGTGEWRFTWVRPQKISFTCGEPKVIDYLITRQKPSIVTAPLFISAHIVDQNGVIIAQCDSRMVGHHLVGMTSRYHGRFIFRSPWLRPGRYRVEMFICCAGIIDRLEDACFLEILPILPYDTPSNEEATAAGLVFADFNYCETPKL